jgi:two-component system sensor histidine kinase BaeS
MKIKIKYRLFLSMLAATGVVVACMFLIMQWSIGRGFLAYVNTMEQERFEKLTQVLETSYAAHGGWDFLRDDPSAWFGVLLTTIPRDGADQERFERLDKRLNRRRAMFTANSSVRQRPPAFGMLSGSKRNQHPVFAELSTGWLPPRFTHRFEGRVFLLDASRTRVAGVPVDESATVKPLRSGGKVVGYVGLGPRKRLTDRHQLLFVQQQKLAMGLIATVMLLVSAAISLPLSNRLVRPIRRLAASMHRLACGAFETRVEVTQQDELGQLARDFNTLALSLEKTEQARRRWMADISHELRTPLSVLRGEIEAIQDGVRQATPQTMNSLHLEVLQLSRLVDDLYQLSLYDIGALSYKKSLFDLHALLRHAVDSFRPDLAHKGITLSWEAGNGGEFAVFADPERLHQLFDNLLDNSLKYTDAGGELSVRLERQGERAVIEFADSAPGVPTEELAKLFDRLYRVESSRNRALGGAGLGLAICKNIVEAHEGSISALDSRKGGVSIVIELPLTGNKG